MRGLKAGVAALGAAILIVGGAGVALAVSTGGYSTAKQGCPVYPDANTFTGAYPGCHNAQLLVTDGQGHTYAEAGTNQLAQGQNLHSGTVMVTPNGDGNPYGDPNGSPYNGGANCPPASEYQPPQPGQQETDQNCPPTGAPAASPVTGPGVGASFDTNWQPIPPDQCGLEDIALYPAELILYLTGQQSSICTLDPTKWQAPSQAPTVTPWVQAGTPNGTAADLAQGGEVYFGGDDNADSGEHDGVDGQYGSGNDFNGASDGGSLSVDWQPQAGAATMATWPSMLAAVAGSGPSALAPIAENPVPVANAGGGACADGICFGAYTNQRTVYQGGGGNGQSSRDVYNYSGKTFGPYNCNSGSPQNEQACQDPSQGGTANCPPDNANNPSCGINYYKQQDANNVNAEPGVQVYADPDPQASPALPPQLYPLPAAYAGTCGVVAGGGGVRAPASPVTNSAGQVVVNPTGC